MNIDQNYLLSQLTALLEIPSPTGYTEDAIQYVKTQLEDLGLTTKLTGKGALIGTWIGTETEQHKTLSAHVDTLGAMVKEIKTDGRVKLTQLGGYAWNSIEGEYCTVHVDSDRQYSATALLDTASTHVHGSEVGKTERSGDNIELRLDEPVKTRQDVLDLGINVGDFVSFEPRNEITSSGFVKSRHLDDKACVAAILSMIKTLVDHKQSLPHTTHFFFSNYEEVGHGASASLPEKTVELLAVDMAAPGQGQASDEQKVTICAKDSSGPYDLKMKRLLTQLATNESIDYVIDVYPFYGSDASAALRAGWELKHGLIGPGVDASHSYERTHIDGLENTVKLGIQYMLAPVL